MRHHPAWVHSRRRYHNPSNTSILRSHPLGNNRPDTVCGAARITQQFPDDHLSPYYPAKCCTGAPAWYECKALVTTIETLLNFFICDHLLFYSQHGDLYHLEGFTRKKSLNLPHPYFLESNPSDQFPSTMFCLKHQPNKKTDKCYVDE